MGIYTLKPGHKLLHRATHESMTYVQPFDDERILVTNKQGQVVLIKRDHVQKDWDRITINYVKQSIQRLWQRLSPTSL